MPKVSVISGYYNRGAVLTRTVDSVLDQTYGDFELYVFDDCSTDDTPRVFEKYSEERADPRLRFVVHERNLGLVGGLRRAIENTTGEYIAIQGSGDRSLPMRLELQAEFLDKHPEVGLVGGWRFSRMEDSSSRRLHMVNVERPSFAQLIEKNYFSHGEVMFRRSTYEKVGGYTEQFAYAQDRELWIRMARVGEVAVLQTPIYERFQLTDGVSYNPHKYVRQRMFSILAVQAGKADEVERSAILARLAAEGPESIVPVSDSRIQSELVQKALRWSFYAPENARTLVRSYVARAGRKHALLLYVALVSSPPMRPFRSLAFRTRGYA